MGRGGVLGFSNANCALLQCQPVYTLTHLSTKCRKGTTIFPLRCWAWNNSNQIVSRGYPASMLSPVSDCMDSNHVHEVNARHAACIHLPRLFSQYSDVDLKLQMSGPRLVSLGITSCPSICSGLRCNRASLSKTVKCIRYNSMLWMSSICEIFRINSQNHSGISMTSSTNKYYFSLLHLCVVCYHVLGATIMCTTI